MKKYLVTSSLIAILSVIPSLSSATPTDRQIVASKAYVDTKQDIITTGLVTFREPEENIDYTVPALVSYGTGTNNADGVLGNKIGILGINLNGGLGSWEFLDPWDESEAAYLDNFVPTVRAVAAQLQEIWSNMPYWSALTWGSSETTSTNAYDITFVGDTGATANAWPRADKTKLINTAALAQGLALKQNKIPAQNTNLVLGQTSNGFPSSVIAPTATPGVVQQVALWDADGGDPQVWNINENYSNDYGYNNSDRTAIRMSIPTVGAVEVGLNTKQDTITTGLAEAIINQETVELPALVSYDSTDGLIGNKIGLLTQAAFVSYEVDWDEFVSNSNVVDNVVPTVTAVANAIKTLDWSAQVSTAISKYSTTFNSTTNNWLSIDGGRLVKGRTFANALTLKQNKLDARAINARAQAVTRGTAGNTSSAYITAGGSVGLTTQSGAPAIINYVNGTVATDEDFTTFTTGTFGANSATNQNYIKNALVSLELLKDVYGELNTKITAAGTALPWTSDEIASATAYDATFTGDTGATADAWPAADKTLVVKGETFAKALATKQNKITTGLVVFEDGAVQGGTSGEDDLTVRALVATNAAGTTLTGNTIGILDANTLDWSDEGILSGYAGYGAEMDNFVPTVRVVADAIGNIWSNMPSSWTALDWSNTQSAAINAYNTTFGNGANNTWTGNGNYLITGQFLANSLALKQNKIPAKEQNSDFYSVLTDTSADGEVGKLQILTAGYMQANGESFASWVPNDNEIVTAGAIHRELLNNWQPIIPASMASNDIAHQTLSLPSFVVANVLTNGASPTLSSGTYGIITQDNIEDYAGLWSEFALLSNMDSAIPTVKAVANAITRLEWNSRIENAINAYRTQFFASGSDVWWFSESDKLINTPVFSKGLALKQNKLAAKASDARAQAVTRSAAGNTSSAYITEGGSVGLTTRSGAPAVINYVNGTVATTEDMTTFTTGTFGSDSTGNQNYIKNALVSLELLKDVYSALHNEIASATPTGTANNVAMYDANGALGDGRPTADVADYNETTGELENGADIATIAAVETKQDKMVCAGYAPDHINDPDYCWLWRFAE